MWSCSQRRSKEESRVSFSLYELSQNYQTLLHLMEDSSLEDEENLKVYQDTLEAIEGAFEDKAENYAYIINQLNSDEKMLNDEIKRLMERKQRIVKNRNRLKDTLKEQMETTGKTKIQSPKVTIWIQNNPPKVEIKDESLIAKKYFIKQAPLLDKQAIKEALKEGHKVRGAELIQTTGLRLK